MIRFSVPTPVDVVHALRDGKPIRINRRGGGNPDLKFHCVASSPSPPAHGYCWFFVGSVPMAQSQPDGSVRPEPTPVSGYIDERTGEGTYQEGAIYRLHMETPAHKS